MAHHKKGKKGHKKSKKSRRRHSRRKTNKPKSMIGFPANRVVKMRYVQQVSLNMTGTGQQVITFRANGIYDPLAAIGGHSALGLDQWAVFYKRYVVLTSKCRFTATNTESMTGTSPLFIGVAISTEASFPLSNFLTYIEGNKMPYRLLTGLGNNVVRSVSNRFNAKNWFNVKDVKDNQDRLGADMNSNPAEEAFFGVIAQTTDNASNTEGVVNGIVQIDYTVLLSDPLDIPQS